MHDVYYRIYQSERIDLKLTVVCMQDFDECDYYEDRFMTDEDGYRLRFDYEEDAIKWLNQNVKPEMIDDDYRRLKFTREDYLL